MGRVKPVMSGAGSSSRSLVPVWHSPDAKDPTLPAILEFQWPSTAIVNAPIPRSARGIVWMITSMVVVLILAAGFIPVDRVVTARGVVVSQTPTILVQPLDTAIVRSIDVREGDRVSAGQVLARLDPTFASADLATLATQVTTLEAEAARLQAEAEGKPFTYTGNDPNWLLQAAIHAHRVAEFDAKTAKLPKPRRRAERHDFKCRLRRSRVSRTPAGCGVGGANAQAACADRSWQQA